MFRLSTIFLAGLVFISVSGPQSDAQDPTNGSVDEPDSAAAETSEKRDILVGLTPAGVQRQVPGRWATLAVNGTNHSSEDSVETSLVTIGDRTDLQFGRRVWLPANARRQAWLSVEIPDDIAIDSLQVPMRSMHLKETDQGESFQTSALGTPTVTRGLLLSWEESRAAAVIGPLNPDLDEVDETAELAKTIYAGRDAVVSGDQDLGMAQFTGHFLPPTANPLDSLDQVVIANDRMLSDTVGITRLRSWLRSGGRIWIMVDQLSPESVRALIGDAICYSIVDRIEMNDYELEQVARRSSDSSVTESWSSETPAELVRVLLDTDDVDIRVDGWPAAFWKKVGHGDVLFTTLSAPGWIREQGDQVTPTSALESISADFFVRRIAPPKHDKALETYLSKEIGYRIPGRNTIAMLLGAHFLLILVAGLWLAKRKSLHQLAFVIPISALITAGILAWMGKQNTDAVPSTIATGQIVRADMNSSEVQVESVAAVYSQQARDLPISTSPESLTLPGDPQPSGETKRILWDDSGDSQWLFLKQPPSKVQNYETNSTVTLPSAWSATGRFNANGFTGELQGIGGDRSEDPIVVSAAGPSLALSSTEGGANLLGGEQNVLLPDQYVDAALMSDVQRDRQSLIRELADDDAGFFDRRPTMLFWTDPINAGARFPDDFSRRGWALVSMPIRLERLAPGTDFQIPASFVELESYIERRGNSTVFNPDTGKWIGISRPSESDLRCVVPPSVLPCDLKSARVVVKATAPGRNITFSSLVDGEMRQVHEETSPAGKFEFDIDQSSLELDAEGGFVISVAISASATQSESTEENGLATTEGGSPSPPRRSSDDGNKWQIDYLHVHLTGTTK